MSHTIIARTMTMLTRQGVVVAEEGSTSLADNDANSDEARTLSLLRAAACTYRVAFGPRASQKVLTLRGAVNSLSDVQTLSPVDALAGSAAADNLLILSLDSHRLLEVDRSGAELSSLDLSGFTTQALEGLTIDEKGVIYLVAEDSGRPASRLFVLASTAPIPEPGSVALMLAGPAALGWRLRQRS